MPRRAVLLAALALSAAPPARADVQVGAEVGVSANRITTTPDPRSTDRLELNPGLSLAFGSGRLTWIAHYRFAGALTRGETEDSKSYHNDLNLSLAAEPTERTTLSVAAHATQGSTLQQITARPVGTVAPTLRGPASPARVSAALTQRLTWQASSGLSLAQALSADANAPQDALDLSNTSVSATLSGTWEYPRDSVGLALTPRYASLHPLLVTLRPHVEVVTGSLQLTWNRDLDERWSSTVTAGAEAVRTLPETRVDVQPVGTAALRYMSGRLSASVNGSHGALAHLEEGTMSLSDLVTLTGGWTLREAPLRAVTGSLGYLWSRPLGAAGIASTEGRAVNADLGLDWGLWGAWSLTGRITLQYQHARPTLPDATIYGFTVGVLWQSNPELSAANAVPRAGQRVDGADGVPFGGGEPGEP